MRTTKKCSQLSENSIDVYCFEYYAIKTIWRFILPKVSEVEVQAGELIFFAICINTLVVLGTTLHYTPLLFYFYGVLLHPYLWHICNAWHYLVRGHQQVQTIKTGLQRWILESFLLLKSLIIKVIWVKWAQPSQNGQISLKSWCPN